MKDNKTKFCFVLQIEYLKDGIMVNQSTYTQKVLKMFNIDNCYPLSTPMVVRALDVTKDFFRPLEEWDDLLDPEIPYLSAIGAFLYMTNYTSRYNVCS